VGSGKPWHGNKVAIVDSKTGCKSKNGHVGEIWIAGPSITQGYWNRDAQTKEAFGAFIADTGEGPFFKTGDLGFLNDHELFVTGRLKDVIIIRGLNYYPHDIEAAIEGCHDQIGTSACAAFSITIDDEEKLAVIVEIDRKSIRDFDQESIVSAVRHSVWQNHELNVSLIGLLKPLSILKTSSGKIQRQACKKAFIKGTLGEAGRWQADKIAN
jgi:acyl-CoA synthetase (AMP-forming)/AMP-acid ligase II